MVETSIIEKGLVKKVFWTGNVKDVWSSEIQSLAHFQKLEEEGFGMLADKEDPKKIDKSESVVFPDGRVFTIKQIENYWTKKNGGMIYNFSSGNPEDVKMHNAQIYYLGFKS